MMAWTLPLPLGCRFSVDAARSGAVADATPVYSLAAPAVLLQLFAIYILNALHKAGPTWRDGSAVYYVLHQERLVTGAGVWLREHAPYRMLTLFTWGTLATEFAAPVTLLLFLWQRRARWAAILSLWALHFGLLLTTNLTQFQLTMLANPLLFLDAEDWAWIESRVRRAQQSVAMPDEAQPRRRNWLGDAWVVLLFVSCLSQLLIENPAITEYVHVQQPAFLRDVVEYCRAFQGWRMFAPDAPLDDGVLVVDAVTTTGAHVDPLTGEAPRFEVAPPRGRYPMSQPWCDYTSRIRSGGFEVWWVWRRTAPPGVDQRTMATGRDKIFAYP
jgi:hypothetical protein